MDQLIIPNWHPILVHFTIALTISSAGLLVFSKLVKSKAADLAIAGKWTLWLAAGVTGLTVLAGLSAYNSVVHDEPAHIVMKIHRLWALITGTSILVVAVWSWRSKTVSTALVAASVVLAGLVGTTGYLGAELVYRHGLGVMRLPDASGAGHHHHGGEADEDHDHDAATHDHDGAAGSSGAFDPASIAEAFQAGLRGADDAAIDRLLDDNVTIIEGGHAETSKADYMAGHMKADMGFLPGIETEILDRNAGQAGDRAWVVTHSRLHGSYKGKPVDMMSREFMMLRRKGEDWKIVLIEWASK